MSDPFTQDLIDLLPNLRRFALSLSKRPDVADDLVQVTAERAFKARDSYDPGTCMDAWLFRILRNAWIDMTRKDKTRGTELDIDETPDAVITDGRKDAETRMELGETARALETLAPEHREILLLVCVEGLSYAEASETLGIPKGTVMSRLARARTALAKKLGIKGEAAR